MRLLRLNINYYRGQHFNGSNSPTRQRLYQGLWLLSSRNQYLTSKYSIAYKRSYRCWTWLDLLELSATLLHWCACKHWCVNVRDNLGRNVAFDSQPASCGSESPWFCVAKIKHALMHSYSLSELVLHAMLNAMDAIDRDMSRVLIP